MHATTSERTGEKKWFRIRLSVLLIVCIGVAGYVAFYQYRPTGNGPAGPAVEKAAFTSVWSERPVRVIGIGDSVTAGFGAKNLSHSYFSRVIDNPTDEFEELRGICLRKVLPNIQYENFAVSGSESDRHLEIIVSEIPEYEDEFGIVLMTSGGNDLIHNYGRSEPRECAMYSATLEQAEPWIDNFARRLLTMFDTIAERFPQGCEIYLGDIYDPTDGIGDAPSIFLPDWPDGLAIHARYNATIRKVASERDFVHVVPLHKTFLGHGSHCRQFWRSTYRWSDPTYWYYTNVEDPNDRGYDAIRRVYLNTIADNTQLRR